MFSKNLKYYRLLRSLSKKELANKIGVTPMAITNYENGTRSPHIEIIKKCAEVLGVTVSDFLVSRNQQLIFVHNEFRKNSTLSESKKQLIQESVEEYFSRFMDAVEILGGETLPESPVCHCLTMTDNPENDASQLRKHLSFANDGPIEDLIGKLENKGFLIYLQQIDDDKFSGINGFVNNRPYIMLNDNMSTERKRSTIVHELAHLMFDWSTSNNPKQVDIETRATAIAGAFLFPKVDAIRELGIHRSYISNDMQLVAKEYGISMWLLTKRAFLCKIITKPAEEAAYKRFSQLGWNKKEPSRIAAEEPSLFNQLVFRAINEGEINITRGCELLKCTHDFVEQKCNYSED